MLITNIYCIYVGEMNMFFSCYYSYLQSQQMGEQGETWDPLSEPVD
jgi:hypothetical protein